jgi:hypothetical protein
MSTGLAKTITDTHYKDGKLFAGFPCKIGHNLAWITYYLCNNSFLNIAKQAAPFFANTGEVTLDSSGWVTGVSVDGEARLLVIQGTSDYKRGNYKIEWEGTANASIQVGAWSLASDVIIDNQTKSGTFTLIDPLVETPGNFYVSFTGGTVTDVKIYLASDEIALNGGQVWSNTYLATLAGQHSFRAMDLMGANNTSDGGGNFHRYTADIQNFNDATWETIPPEAIAALANEADLVPWVNMPPQCSDAYVTEWFTRFKSVLEPERRVMVELANEVWNYLGVFSSATYWFAYPTEPIQYATVSGDVFTLVGHGMVTGDIVHCYPSSKKCSYYNYYAMDREQHVIKLTDDTFSLAISAALSATSTVNSPPDDMSELRFRQVVGPEGTQNFEWNESYGIRAGEVFALANAVMTRDRCDNVCAIHTAGGNYRNRFPANSDFIAIAPYANYTDMPNLLTATDDEILAHLIDDQIPILTSRVQSLRQYSNLPFICYEGGDETYDNGDEAKAAVITRFFASPQMGTFMIAYGEMLANLSVREYLHYNNLHGAFASQEFLNTSGGTQRKLDAIKMSLPLGFTRS